MDEEEEEEHQQAARMGERENEDSSSSSWPISIGEDIQFNILSRLPASSFASASCVNRSFNRLCNQILSKPKLFSAYTLNPSLQVAFDESLDKVLSEPIRPDFAILFTESRSDVETYELSFCYRRLRKKLGSTIPIIISHSQGLLGTQFPRPQLNDQFQIDWQLYYDNADQGVVLIVGFMPGMRIKAIPFLLPIEGNTHVPMNMMDKFVEDIEEYSSSVSGFTSPTGIMMFTDHFFHLQPLLDKMDYALSSETVIVGGEGGCFLYNNGVDSTIFGGCKHFKERQNTKSAAVALVFATDKAKSHGSIHFNLVIANGLSPIGPIFEGASVKVTNDGTFDYRACLTARIEGSHEILGGWGMLDHIENEREEVDFPVHTFIGVTKRRKCSIKSRKPELISSLSFYEVNEGTEEHLFLARGNIRRGDKFCFYHPFRRTAQLAHSEVYEELRILKQSKVNREEVIFGGLMFACSGRDLLLGGKSVCSSAFLENFPGVPLARMFCSGEIGRGNSISTEQDKNDKNHICSSLHVYSTVYLVMSYTPKPLED